ncbi:hypothetical protein EG329_010861 [Mollisiaceae sp. DMI_Dod_QoI]|nr:hypothetical protein EG329_010861 [Helotiales sp. DMI_Dod_QoI]
MKREAFTPEQPCQPEQPRPQTRMLRQQMEAFSAETVVAYMTNLPNGIDAETAAQLQQQYFDGLTVLNTTKDYIMTNSLLSLSFGQRTRFLTAPYLVPLVELEVLFTLEVVLLVLDIEVVFEDVDFEDEDVDFEDEDEDFEDEDDVGTLLVLLLLLDLDDDVEVKDEDFADEEVLLVVDDNFDVDESEPELDLLEDVDEVVFTVDEVIFAVDDEEEEDFMLLLVLEREELLLLLVDFTELVVEIFVVLLVFEVETLLRPVETTDEVVFTVVVDVVFAFEEEEEDFDVLVDTADEVLEAVQPPTMLGTAFVPLPIGTMFVPQFAA